jgi:hypothetical protein
VCNYGVRGFLCPSLCNLIVQRNERWNRDYCCNLNCRAGGSIDTEMDRIHLHVDTPCMKSASKKSVFGSLERSMDRLLCMLTPKKKRSSPSFDQPRIVKVFSEVFFQVSYNRLDYRFERPVLNDTLFSSSACRNN